MVILALALPALGATPPEFYVTMLRKGIAAHDAGRFEAATSPLRVAAFGLVDSVEHYQTAHVYLALSFDRLGNAEQARDSARRVVAAERIEARYGSLDLPAETRASFQAVARKSLTEADLAALGRSARSVTAPPQTTTQTPPRTTPQTTQAQPATNQPATTQPPVQTSQSSSNSANSNAPVVNKPAPVTTTPVQTPVVKPATAKPTTTTTTEATTPPPVKTQPAPVKQPVNVGARITAAEQALSQSRLTDARAIYRELLDANNLQRADILRVAEGLYRSRDFAHALRAFDKLGALRREEQPYRYYIAVAYYETGQYTKAKDELTAVLPFIEETADVSRYRVKIENAIN